MKKILLFGPEVSDFLNPLAAKLKELGYTIDVIENRKTPREKARLSQAYSNVLNYQEIAEKRKTVAEMLKTIFSIELYKNFFKILFTNCLEKKCGIFKSLKNSLNFQLVKNRFSSVVNHYDIINFHSISPGTLPFIKAISLEKKIILSFWGSDLFQINGVKNYYEQLEAIKRANTITVMSYEMEFMITSKFGNEFKNRIVKSLLGLNEQMFDLIDATKKQPGDFEFLKKYNIPEDKIKITICYCGNPICNHLQTLDELIKLEPAVKKQIHLLVPMTYGNFSNEYLEEIKYKLANSGITFTLFLEYLSLDEVVKLRINSDIMIMMSKSDALSASVTEYLYADNLLISASWLPYSPYRIEEVVFYETDFSKLSKTVSYSVKNFKTIKPALLNNPQKVRKLTSITDNWKKWVDIIYS